MAIFCRHGEGAVVRTEEHVLVYVVQGVIHSSSLSLNPQERQCLQDRFVLAPPRRGTLSPYQLEAAFRISYLEPDHPDDRSLGSTDTWSTLDIEDAYESDLSVSSASDDDPRSTA